MRRFSIAVALLLFAGPAIAHENACPAAAADGVRVAVTAGQSSESPGTVRSNSQENFAHWMCCNQAAGACDDFDTMARAGGPASRYVVSLEDVAGCTAVDVTVGFREDASGVNHTVGTISLTTDSLVIDGPRPRFVTAVVNTATACATNIDLRLNTYHNRADSAP